MKPRQQTLTSESSEDSYYNFDKILNWDGDVWNERVPLNSHQWALYYGLGEEEVFDSNGENGKDDEIREQSDNSTSTNISAETENREVDGPEDMPNLQSLTVKDVFEAPNIVDFEQSEREDQEEPADHLLHTPRPLTFEDVPENSNAVDGEPAAEHGDQEETVTQVMDTPRHRRRTIANPKFHKPHNFKMPEHKERPKREQKPPVRFTDQYGIYYNDSRSPSPARGKAKVKKQVSEPPMKKNNKVSRNKKK